MNKREAGKLGYLKTFEIFKAKYKQRLDEYKVNPTRCKFCNTPLPYKRRKDKFCNHSCAAKYYNFSRVRVKYNPPANCLYCARKLENWRKKYCNSKCCGLYRRFKVIQRWKAGEYVGYVGRTLAISKSIRIYLIQLANNRCVKCGWDKVNSVTKVVPLEINHIDGNAKNCSLNNLEVLCPNCHALTPNFRNLNKNSKRKRMP